jgi:hypothetical protein
MNFYEGDQRITSPLSSGNVEPITRPWFFEHPGHLRVDNHGAFIWHFNSEREQYNSTNSEPHGGTFYARNGLSTENPVGWTRVMENVWRSLGGLSFIIPVSRNENR